MVDTLTIELGFSQQVAAEALKTLRNSHFAAKVTTLAWVPDSLIVTEIKF